MKHPSFTREKVPLAIFDTIAAPPLRLSESTRGRLFCIVSVTTEGFLAVGSNGILSSDKTMEIERVVLEARSAQPNDLGVLRTDLRLRLILGEKEHPLLPPFLDKIDPDGTARFDYFTNPYHEDPEIVLLRREAEQAGDKEMLKELTRQPLFAQVPARMGFRVEYTMTEHAMEILRKPDSLARVWLTGTLTRDAA